MVEFKVYALISLLLVSSVDAFTFRRSRNHGALSRSRSHLDIQKRASASVSVSGWSYLGCYNDGTSRALISAYTSSDSLTVETCLATCKSGGYTYAGVEYGKQCYCGNVLSNNVGSKLSTSCTYTCAGSSSEICGGSYALSLYAQYSTASLGCYSDSSTRLLSDASTSSSYMSPMYCASFCYNKGYLYYGVEYGSQCYCSSSAPSLTKSASSSKCTTSCSVNDGTICGASWYLNVYSISKLASATTTSKTSTTISKTSTTTSKTTATTTSKATTTTTPKATTTSKTSTSTSKTTTTTTGAASASAVSCTGNCTATTGVASPASATGTKLLWAHHMVGNTYSYTSDTWSSDVSQAAAAGFDGFALNFGTDYWQPARLNDAYAAAESQGSFKMFLSFDFSSLGCTTAAQASTYAGYITTYGASSAQAEYNNKVLVSTFAGEECTFGQSNATAGWTYLRSLVTVGGYSIYLIPAIFSSTSSLSNMTWFDGVFNWNGGWPASGSTAALDISSDTTYMSALGSKGYMPAISPLFFTYYSPSSYNKNWIYRSDDWLLARRFEQLIAMRSKVGMAEVITWNDYGESHYVGPIRTDQPNSQGWTDGMPHTAWLDLIAYYAPAFQKGSYPSILTDKLWLWTRPHPRDATPSAPTLSRPSYWYTTNDNLYALVLLKSAATVTITSGTNSGTWNLPSGLSKLAIASKAGTISGKIVRSSTTVASYNSSSTFTYTATPTDYNYNYFVASA